jgi:hypothetical protein
MVWCQVTLEAQLKEIEARATEREALSKILVPLIGYALDVGLSVREMQGMCRVAAVRAAADRQLAGNLRISISGIAAITGLPRSEVSRILRIRKTGGQFDIGYRPHSINKILSVWNESPKFNYQSGRPADLKIYGPGRTFESLARRHGGGLPVRAVLDELIRSGSVEIIDAHTIRFRSSVSMNRRANARDLKLFSQRAAQLLEGMLYKIRKPDSHFILSNIEGDISEDDALPVFRKEVVTSSDDLLAGLRESLFRIGHGGGRKGPRKKGQRIRMTILYQEIPHLVRKNDTAIKRKNFRRSSR